MRPDTLEVELQNRRQEEVFVEDLDVPGDAEELSGDTEELSGNPEEVPGDTE